MVDYPRKPVPFKPDLPLYGSYRTGTFNGWSWAIETKGAPYTVRDASGKVVAKGARTWWVAMRWATANCHREDAHEDRSAQA